MANNNSKSELIKLPVRYRLSDESCKIMGIPKICPICDHEELWAYTRFDRHPRLTAKKRFITSTYGRVYDLEKRKLVKSHGTVFEAKNRYQYQEMRFPYKSLKTTYVKYFVHRLVMLSFYPVDYDRPFVNHKDGCPEHNYIWNLEWTNNSENMKHAIRTGLKNEPLGEKRSNALWSDEEIKLICSMMEDGHKATYIFHSLSETLKDPKVTYERVRALYKHIIHQTHWTHISKNYNIDFRAKNYAKEKGSVEAAKNREKRIQYPETVLGFNSKAKDKNRGN